MDQDKITVSVTQQDIDKGHPRQCDNCPIALAATRSTGCEVEVTHDGIYAYADGIKIYSIPAAADTFMALFDTEQSVQPFTFETWRVS